MDRFPPRSTMPPATVTVADVARQAGVSKATAARVLGGYGTVSERVRDAVKTAALTLDYRPNELARSMTTGRSGTIGVVVGDIENSFFGLAMRGITDVARQAGFTVILTNSGEDVAAEKAAVRTLLAKRVDGLIVSPARENDVGHLSDVMRSGRPIVLLDRGSEALDVDTVIADDRQAAEAVTRRLIALGHREIAYLTAYDSLPDGFRAPSDIQMGSVRRRVEGFLHAGHDAGIEDMARWVCTGATTPAATLDIVRSLIAATPRATAIIASDSIIGLDVFKACRELGVSLPSDMSLVSFHNADWTSVTSPPISVVEQPVYELGTTAAALLVERLRGSKEKPRTEILSTHFIARESLSVAKTSVTGK